MDVALTEFSPGFQVFADRHEAGERLARALDKYRGRDVLVLGIPRGGLPVAAVVAERLGAELDIVVARKVGVPFQPELALGAVTANGGLFLNESLLAELDLPEQTLGALIAKEREVARGRQQRFRKGRPPVNLAGRTVILVDDGLATGATMRAAVHTVRKANPAHLVVAIPVAPRSTCEILRTEADEVVCLLQPEQFFAVGIHYQDFLPVPDDEVSRILARAWQTPKNKSRSAARATK